MVHGLRFETFSFNTFFRLFQMAIILFFEILLTTVAIPADADPPEIHAL
jgi:hypothetical protein